MTGAGPAPADQRAAVAALAAAACGVGGLVALAVGSGPVWPVVLTAAGLALLVSVLLAVRLSPVTMLVGLGVAASCWDAVRVGPSLFDVLCSAGLVAVLADAVLHRDAPVRWPARACWVAIGGFGLATVLVTLFPPDSFYYSSRFELSRGNLAGAVSSGATEMTDVGGMARLLIGLVMVPLVLGWYARDWPRLAVVGRAFVAGALVSSVVGLSDYLGVTAIGETLLGYANGGNRSTGLTSQPNHLALTAVMALPFVWFLVPRWPVRAAVGLVLVGGIVVSGSRAGLIGAAVAVVGCLFWQYRARFLMLAVPLGVAVLLASSELLSYTRFGTEGAADSDVERTMVLNQGLEDFGQSPLFGIGLRVSQEAHVVYLQLLASSGLIGLLSFVLLMGAALAGAYRLRQQPAVLAAGIALTAYLAVAAASNALLVRYVFVPLAIVFVAARHLAPRGRPASGTAPEPPAMASIVADVETPGVRGR